MDDKLLAGLVAGSISLLVAGLSYLGTKRQLQAQREKLEREIDAKHADKLYDLRLKHYPRCIEITAKLSIAKSVSGEERRNIYAQVRSQLKEWRLGEPMLVLSKHSMVAIRELEDALKKNPSDTKGMQYSEEQLIKIWRRTMRFRGSLRYDLGLLFEDHGEKDFRGVGLS